MDSGFPELGSVPKGSKRGGGVAIRYFDSYFA